jgi:hypothetical protein
VEANLSTNEDAALKAVLGVLKKAADGLKKTMAK